VKRIRVSRVPALLLLLLLLGASAVARAQTTGTLRLVVGQQSVLAVSNLKKVAIGDPTVADVKVVNRKQILVLGRGQGSTNMTIWKKDGTRSTYDVHVTAEDPNKVVREVLQLLGDREGIRARVVGNRVVLDGTAYTQDDFDRVDSITALYSQVTSFVKLNPNAKKLIAEQLNARLAENGLKDARAVVVGTTIFLEGSVESKQDLKKAELIAGAMGEKVDNMLGVGIKRMVLIEVNFVEVRKKSDDEIGFNWPGIITGNGAAFMQWNFWEPEWYGGGMLGMPVNNNDKYGFVAGTITSDASIKLLFQDGYARMLAQPKLVCASGEQAKFLAGGEIPIVMVTANTSSVEWKEYGARIDLKPLADTRGNIQMQMMTEISDIDWSNAVMGVPAFLTRRAESNVTVRHGETIVLSGLFKNAEQKDVEKFPFLGNIPILGELFKSRHFLEKKSELLIFVTPRVVNPETERIKKMIREMKNVYKRAKDQVGYDVFD